MSAQSCKFEHSLPTDVEAFIFFLIVDSWKRWQQYGSADRRRARHIPTWRPHFLLPVPYIVHPLQYSHHTAGRTAGVSARKLAEEPVFCAKQPICYSRLQRNCAERQSGLPKVNCIRGYVWLAWLTLTCSCLVQRGRRRRRRSHLRQRSRSIARRFPRYYRQQHHLG